MQSFFDGTVDYFRAVIMLVSPSCPRHFSSLKIKKKEKKKCNLAEEMSWLVKCLLCNQEDPSSTEKLSISVVHASDPALCKAEKDGYLGLTGHPKQ